MHILPDFSRPVLGLVDLVKRFRSRGIRIGSTTGYTVEMARLVAESAAEHGYSPDVLVTVSDVPKGRLYPWMCFQNAVRLEVFPMFTMVTVGDTVVDIQEGLKAGMWTVGVIQGSSLLGWTQNQVETADDERLRESADQVRQTFLKAGAHFVIDHIAELESVLHRIEEELKGLLPIVVTMDKNRFPSERRNRDAEACRSFKYNWSSDRMV